jgi:hypothetical protein
MPYSMQPDDDHGSIPQMDRRAHDKWTVSREINLPTIISVGSALLVAMSFLITLRNDINNERDARLRMEAVQLEQRNDAGKTRIELSQQQSQVRIELQQQISSVQTGLDKGLDKIEAKLDRGMSELRSDIKSLTTANR